MRALVSILFALAAGPAVAQVSCAPMSTDVSILASADVSDIHPEWADGSTVGLGWTLVPYGDEVGTDGEWYMIGDLLDADGGPFSKDVYVDIMEWECDEPD